MSFPEPASAVLTVRLRSVRGVCGLLGDICDPFPSTRFKDRDRFLSSNTSAASSAILFAF